MNARKTMLRWASGIMIVLGAGHLALASFFSWRVVAGWADNGFWAAVPLLGHRGVEPSVELLQTKSAFWAGIGSFSVPLILLGCMTWHLANRDIVLPAAIGWVLATWCATGGVLLVPSPFFAGVVAGVLIILAARAPTASFSNVPK